ncbi:MAG: universal stress protein [Deltaproteobacteria bacterium]|nr:universal stress protein [Deltaproteobacteria bacterium]
MIRKILAPTDLSDLSKDGVRYALQMAAKLGAEVTAYHVVDFAEIERFGRDLERGAGTTAAPPRLTDVVERHEIALAQFLGDNFADLLPSVTVREIVEMGRPAESIVQRAVKDGSDLIVISTHGRRGLSHALLGSVTEKVVRTASCPVLSIRPSDREKVMQEAAGLLG